MNYNLIFDVFEKYDIESVVLSDGNISFYCDCVFDYKLTGYSMLKSIFKKKNDEVEPQFVKKFLYYSISNQDNKMQKYKSKEKLVSFLDSLKNYDIIEYIAGYITFKNIDEVIKYRNFEKASMKDILNQYENADTFSLTCPYNLTKNEFVHLDQDICTKVIEMEKQIQHKELLTIYNTIGNNNIGSFDSILDIITHECENRNKYKEPPFFNCDAFLQGETKFTEPKELWHFYHSCDFLQEMKYNLNKMQESKNIIDIHDILKEDKYYILSANLLKTTIGFSWHCTTSSCLSTTYYFALNDKTKQWLLQFDNDYMLDELRDLALYKNNTILYSSCTHEQFRNDLTK